jgi:hypothetical protein
MTADTTVRTERPMVWALLAAFLTKRPPWLQAVVVGLCVGLFVAASAEANQRSPLIASVVLLVLAPGAAAGVLFFLGLRVQRRHGSTPSSSPRWVGIVYVTVWVVSIVAAIRALFGDGGFKVAVLAIVPIVLLAPAAIVAIRTISGHPPAPPRTDASTTSGT